MEQIATVVSSYGQFLLAMENAVARLYYLTNNNQNSVDVNDIPLFVLMTLCCSCGPS